MADSDNIRILCTADLHLGRYPTRVEPGVDAFTVRHVWKRMVDHAVNQQVDAVVLAGDIIDAENRFFESFGVLKRGIERLVSSGITVFAVAGNHDYDVFPELHDALALDGFHLLGRSGSWETVSLERRGEPVLYVAGWSFPRRHVAESPLSGFSLPGDVRSSGVPTLGVLHGDLDTSESRYAPVSTSDLNAAPVDAWILGHIHRPARYAHRNGFLLYPGSPQPLRTGETGSHGPWMVTVEPASGRIDAEQLPLATIAYEALEIDLTGADDRGEFRKRVLDSLDELALQLSEQRPELDVVSVLVRYRGRTRLHREIRSLDSEVREEYPFHGIDLRIVDADFHQRPHLDLEQLSDGRDPVAVLARMVREIDADRVSPKTQTVIDSVLKASQELHQKPAYGPLRSDSEYNVRPTLDQARLLAREQALLLIDQMMQQKPAAE